MPRWTADEKLRAEVKRLVRGIRRDASAAKRDKWLVCDLCLARAHLRCPGRRHWLCEHCLIGQECGCAVD